MPDGPVSLLPNEATALENADLIYVSKDIGPGTSYDSQRMTHTNLRSTLGLTGTDGFLSRYTTGDVLGTESKIYESGGLTSINSGAAVLDSIFAVRYPGGLPNPTNLMQIDSVSGGGFRIGRLGSNIFMGRNYLTAPAMGEDFRVNTTKTLFTTVLPITNLNSGTFNFYTGVTCDLRMLCDDDGGHRLWMHSNNKFATLNYNLAGLTDIFAIDIDGLSIAKFHGEGGVTFTELDDTAQGLLTPTNGMMIYNTTSNCPRYWNGSSWLDMKSPIPPKAFSALTPGAPTWDYTTGYNKTLLLTTNTLITITNITSGDSGNLIVQRDATTTTTINFTNAFEVVNNGNLLVTPNANAIDIFSWTFDGTTLFINKGIDY